MKAETVEKFGSDANNKTKRASGAVGGRDQRPEGLRSEEPASMRVLSYRTISRDHSGLGNEGGASGRGEEGVQNRNQITSRQTGTA